MWVLKIEIYMTLEENDETTADQLFVLLDTCKTSPGFNPFHATVLSLFTVLISCPLEIWENSAFLMFSGGIERDQWYEMG